MSVEKKHLGALGALFLALMLATTAAVGQSPADTPPDALGGGGSDLRGNSVPALITPTALPRMAPELALATYENRAVRQNAALGACADTVLIRAELPDTLQKGEYEVRRFYTAPKNLSFAALKFVGDSFVKTNVILRFLQSEQDHVTKGQDGDISISSRNYKFSYKGTETLNSRTLHVYQVKPRKKRVGLFKGHVYVDAFTGSLARVEGTLVKSPSFFIKKLEFVQEYEDFGEFTLPVHIHSDVKARIVGRAVVDVYHRDYEAQAISNVPQQQGVPAAPAPGLH